jgi:hypothetical protein
MSRQWRYGDVALWARGRTPVLRTDSGRWTLPVGTSVEICEADLRPVVVIDPEDWQAMLSIVQEMNVHHPGEIITGTPEKLQNALRSQLKPAEPTGRFAVVEDCNEVQWVNFRDPDRPLGHEKPWINGDDSRDYRDYADIAVVRVLSEGVTPDSR